MTEDLVYSATAWVTNAQMIADVAKLGYLKDTDLVLDPTYGRGTWWRLWNPSDHGGRLVSQVRSDRGARIYSMGLGTRWDFRRMWYQDQQFDAVAFDPPYVSVGGRTTSGIKGMHDAYGMTDAPTSPQGVQDDIDAGLAECWRVVKKGGIVLVKCQSYVSSGKLWDGEYKTKAAAYALGFQLVDQLNHISGARPQPEGRGPQKHSRRNQSDLLVLKRPKRS